MPDPTVPTVLPTVSPDPVVSATTADTLPIDSSFSNVNQTGDGDYRYQGWGEVTTIELVTGLRQSAVCGPAGTPAEEVRVDAGKGRKTVQGVALRIGKKPLVPSASTGQPNETLIRATVQGYSPQKMPNGRRLYCFTWHYVYDLQSPLLETDSITIGLPPDDVGSPEWLDPSDYIGTLNSPSRAPAAFSGTRITY